MSYFQQYEQRRKSYEPGAIWVDKYEHTIRRLQIIDKSKLSPETRIEQLYQSGVAIITFQVLETLWPHTRLSPGTIASWSKDYMEHNYEVLIDD